MGVTGLWKELHSASSKEIFDKLALEVFSDALEDVQAGKPLDRNKLLGLRVGVDASAWFHHSEKTESGANPHLRTLFFRVARLARCGCLPLFVFDGPHRPKWKRGRYIVGNEHGFQRDFEKIVEAFGFEWRLAPGEAEAELAMLNARGTLDLVITDDVDCLLFGATKVMKHAILAKTSWTPTVYPCVYDADVMALETGISTNGLILVALMSGGDYDQTGLEGIGPVISMALAKADYGDQLAEAIRTLPRRDLTPWLEDFRERIRYELRHNPRGILDRKAGAKADKIGPSWPKVETAMRYYNPVVSSRKDYRDWDKEHKWDGKVDIGKIVGIMDEYFEYLNKEILQTLRSSIWDVIIIQHLVRSLYNGNQDIQTGEKLTPTKKLAAALDAFDLTSPASSSSSAAKLKTALPAHIRPIFRQVTKARGACQTSYTDEVQLIIDPTSLADEARLHLPEGEPNAGKLEKRKEAEWKQKLAAGLELGDAPPANRQLKCDDPDSEEKYWIPESLLRLAYPEIIQKWEDAVAAKEEAKANKGRKKATKKDAVSSSSSPAKSPPKAKASKASSASPTKAVAAKKSVKGKAPAKAASYSSSDSEPPKKRNPPKSAPITYSDSDSEEDVFSPKKLPASSTLKAPAMAKSASTSSSSASTYTAAAKGTAKANARAASAISNSESSDSDIEIVTKKSPKKSPRKSDSQQTARPPAVLPVKSFTTTKSSSGTQAVKAQAKVKAKQFEYMDLPDEDSEDEALPDIPKSHKDLSSQAIRPSYSSASSSSFRSSGDRSSSSTSTSSLLSHKSSKDAPTTQSNPTAKRAGSAARQPSQVIVIDSDSD